MMSNEVEPQSDHVADDPEKRSPGQRLRMAREESGRGLQDVAYTLHIDLAILTAIEKDDFERMGAPVFARGHLRNYARHLGLDPDDLIRDYESFANPEAPDLVGERTEINISPGSGPWIGVVSWMLIIALVVLAAIWLYHHPLRRLHVSTQSSASTPVQQAPADSAPSATRSDQAAVRAVTSEDAAQSAPQPSSQDASAASVQSSQDDDLTAPAQDTATAATADVADRVVLDLALEGDSWVEVYDKDGQRLYYGLAHADSKVHVQGAAPLRVFLGDASVVTVRVDGKPFDQTRYEHSDNTARFRISAPDHHAAGG